MRLISAFWVIALLAALASPANAQSYYADVKIVVDMAGETQISGISNHPELAPRITQQYTSKQGEFWVLNITLPENFSEYIYEIEFPKNTAINYLSVPKSFRMESNGNIRIIATGMEQPFFILAQYSFGPKPYSPYSFSPEMLLIFLGSLGLIVIALYPYMKDMHRNGTHSESGGSEEWVCPKETQPEAKIKENIQKEPPKPLKAYNPALFTERQNKILEIIAREGGHATQAKIQKETNIPKASLSRNIDALVRRKVILRERKGMTMVLYFPQNQA
jgi:uncharacterized membrane protein